MKKTKLYTVTGICVILAAITLVTTKNTNITGASGTKQTEIHQDKRISKQTFVNDEAGNRAGTSVNNKVKDASASQPVLSAVSTQKSYNAYVCEDDSQLLYIQDQTTDKTQTITVEPHLATGIMSLEWLDDKMIVYGLYECLRCIYAGASSGKILFELCLWRYTGFSCVCGSDIW